MYTSGFEGPWTTSPLQWGNAYFHNLLNFTWTLKKSPALHQQFKASGPGASDEIMMLVSDVGLTKHNWSLPIVQKFAANLSALDDAFARAWYQLAARDMGPATRCIGPFVPPPQPWQNPLPPPPSPDQLPQWDDVKTKVLAAMRPAQPSPALAPDHDGTSLYYGAAFIKLAWQCAATFRRTDYLGGCNGARVRLDPQQSWPVNRGMHGVLQVLQPVKDAFPQLSWADLIVFASHVAIEDSAAAAAAPAPKPFCPVRTDATAGDTLHSLQVKPARCNPAPSSHLITPPPPPTPQPIIGDSASDVQYRQAADLLGLTLREMVALHGRVRSASLALLQGYNGSWTSSPAAFGNQFYVTLLGEMWQNVTIDGVLQYKAAGKDMCAPPPPPPPPQSPSPAPNPPPLPLPSSPISYMAPADLNILWAPDLLVSAQEFAASASSHAMAFHSAWAKVPNNT